MIQLNGLSEDIKLYLNGRYQTSQSKEQTYIMDFFNTRPMRFGKWGGFHNYADTFIDTEIGALMVYGKTLNDKEIRQNYDALKWEFK